jgi:2-polyprenyl-3-methyl-5-hydroxy-6-metoxy-1,4-benzoquinol methylase
MDNIQYYNDNAEKYLQSISDVNINSQLNEFLSKIKKGGLILDGGCGTGRDSLYMKRKGYDVVAFDASEKMAQIASETTEMDVLVDARNSLSLTLHDAQIFDTFTRKLFVIQIYRWPFCMRK